MIMRELKETKEYRADTESEAKSIMEEVRNGARDGGYTVGAAGYTFKQKKAKGEVIDEAYVVKITKVYGGVWD